MKLGKQPKTNIIAALFVDQKLANRATRRAQGWRGPLPPNLAEYRERHRHRKQATASSVRAKIDRMVDRLGIN